MKSIAELNENKKLIDFMDDHFLIGNRIVLKDGSIWIDPGDALQRTGYLAIAEALIEGPQSARPTLRARLKAHQIGPGLYVRHRFSEPWAAKLSVTSGDQLRPVIIAMGLCGMYEEVFQVATRVLLRGGFYWNIEDTGNKGTKKSIPDMAQPDHWAMFIRALGPLACILFLPILLFGDLFGVIATLNATFVYPYQKIKNADQLNRIAMLTQGVAVFPTPFSKLSHYIFKRFRPVYRLLAEDYITETHTYRTRYFQDIPDGQPKKSVVNYINEAYFWAPADPPLHKHWYAVSKKYWE